MTGKVSEGDEDWDFILIAENNEDSKFLAEIDERCGANGTLRIWYKEITGVARLNVTESGRV